MKLAEWPPGTSHVCGVGERISILIEGVKRMWGRGGEGDSLI